MALAFSVTAPIPKSNGKPMSRAALLDAIRAAVEDATTDPFLKGLLRFGQNEHELAALLYPAAEPLFFVWDPSGQVGASARTSSGGPGYHEHAVRIVRAVGERCQIDWDWSDDETGFATHNDFGALQDAMAEFLSHLARIFTSRQADPSATLAANMPLPAPIPARGGPFSITPLGPRSLEWWQACAQGRNLTEAAADFFPWWNRGTDADFFRKLGLVLLWTQVRWRPPEDEAEEQDARLALECFDRAAELDPTIQLPEAEIAELRTYLSLDEDDEPPTPAPGLIGYFRAELNRPLPGDWTIILPGYWQESFDEENGTLTLWHRDRAVHVTTYTFEPEPGHAAPDPDEVARLDPEVVPDGAEHFEFREGGRVGRAWIGPQEEDGQAGIVLQGCIAAPGVAAEVTIWFESPDDRAWAEATFRSVEHAGSGEPAAD